MNWFVDREPESEVDPEVEGAWRAEIERRVAELDAGTVETVPWEVVEAKLLRGIRD